MPSKATYVGGNDPGYEELEAAGDSIMLVIPRAMWETLVRQGRAEEKHPGEVLNTAIRRYLEEHGSVEAVDYLHALSRHRR